MTLADVAYADDVALPVVAPAPDIIDVVWLAAGTMFDELVGAALKPNLEPGKSEVVVAWAGAGAWEAREPAPWALGRHRQSWPYKALYTGL